MELRMRNDGARRNGMGSRLVLGCILAATVLSALPSLAQSLPGESQRHYAARMKWWTEAKLGVFICWGPCSIAAQEIGWSRNGPRPGGFPPGEGGVPMDVYDNLYKRFDPVKFDAREWVRVIKDSGAKYMIFLTRHHDGFSMWDTAFDDYKITNTPFKRDVTGELAQACHEAGIKIIWYYSQPNWHHPDYMTEHHDRFIKYLHGQVRELLTKYGKIDGMWFDGLYGGSKEWDSPALFKMIHELQPGITINNRGGLAGDYDTPEQTIGSFQIKHPWESCITMGTGWSWTGENAPVKPLKECLQILVRCAGGGGNLALDTGPMPDGRIDPRQVDNYRKMGEWLHKYGESIYATTGGPYRPGEWGACTRKGDTVYLHIFTWAKHRLRLPPLGRKVIACRALTGGTATCRQSERALTVEMPAGDRNDTDTIVALTLDGSAMDQPAENAFGPGVISVGKTATASSIWSAEYSAQKAFDGDTDTRWGGAPDSRSGWLQVDFGKPMACDRILVMEEPWNRVRKFELQYQDGDTWRTFHTGTTLGTFRLSFPRITAQKVRLNVLEATDVPTIWEVAWYGPGGR